MFGIAIGSPCYFTHQQTGKRIIGRLLRRHRVETSDHRVFLVPSSVAIHTYRPWPWE